MPDDRDKTYDVGFGKPPRHRQFRKGVSGNPKGRPKGSVIWRRSWSGPCKRRLLSTRTEYERRLPSSRRQ